MDEAEVARLISTGGVRVSSSGFDNLPRFSDLQPISSHPQQSIAALEPFTAGPGPTSAPGSFYPDVPTVPKEEGGGIVVLSKAGEHRYKFHFHPEQAYGDQWIDEHSLVFAAFMREPIIDFVRSVAGEQGLKDENAFLRTGFEDIKTIMRKSLPQAFDMFQGGGGTSFTGPQPPPSPGKEGASTNPNVFSKTAMDELKDILGVLTAYGQGDDALRAFNYLQRRSAMRDSAVVAWLTLPMNLGSIYFSNDLKSAIEDGLRDVHAASNRSDDGTLFAEILHDAGVKNTFKRIVSKRLDMRKYINRAGSKAQHVWQTLESQYNDLLLEFSRKNYRSVIAPAQPSTIGFSSTQSGVTTTRLITNI